MKSPEFLFFLPSRRDEGWESLIRRTCTGGIERKERRDRIRQRQTRDLYASCSNDTIPLRKRKGDREGGARSRLPSGVLLLEVAEGEVGDGRESRRELESEISSVLGVADHLADRTDVCERERKRRSVSKEAKEGSEKTRETYTRSAPFRPQLQQRRSSTHRPRRVRREGPCSCCTARGCSS